MTEEIRHKIKYYQIIIPIFAGSLLVTGCAEIGGQSVSLLPNSKLTDPLEVPPGLSPLPEPEQFVVPGELDAPGSGPPELGPEQLRAYKLWSEFEEFKKYQDQIQGVGLTDAEFQTAKLSGEGIFKLLTVQDYEADTIRLVVHDSADSVWKMLPSVLADMSAFVLGAENDTRTLLVGNTGVKQSEKFLQRFKLKEYSGSIDKIQVVSLGANKAEISGYTEQDVPVNPKAGEEFFDRLRFYMLARYEAQEASYAANANQDVLGKQLIQGSDGQQAIIVEENFATTWVKVGRILQGAGAGIQDMNRSEGVYYVSFAESTKQRKEKKFRWQFWRPKDVELPDQHQYQVFVKERGEDTEISVVGTIDKSDEEYNPEFEKNILLIIYERLLV